MRKFAIIFFCLVPLLLSAAEPSVKNTAKGVELKNYNFSICLSSNAELLSFIDLKTNSDIASQNGKKIASVKLNKGNQIEASNLSLKGNVLHIYFDSLFVDLRIDTYDDYFAIEVIDAHLPEVTELVFLDLTLKYDYTDPRAFIAAGLAMTLNTDHVFYPSGESKEVKGRCMIRTGFKGAKVAIVAYDKQNFWDLVKKVYRSIPDNSVPLAYHSGGPFAQESEANRFDCVIIGGSEVEPSKVSEWISFYNKKLGVRQFDFHHGKTTFIQGQFTFPVLGSAKAFKEQITTPLYSTGVISTLHSYSYYIDYTANEILSNHKWQQQLEFRGSFPLEASITPTATEIAVAGRIPNRENDFSFTSVYSPFLLIDNEIVRYTVGENGFVSCKRGQCGTVATNHKKGTSVKIIGGYYHMIAPQIGSELFYEIARRTAVAYNEGGFRGFYFDAFDGLGMHLKYAGLGDYVWYYGAAFINEVLKYCQTPPEVIEYSHIYPSVWSARGRGESWDRPHRGYKIFIDTHTKRNQSLRNCNYSTTLGWFDFYQTGKAQPGNFSTKYLFSDDMDYLGCKSLAYDQTMIYEGLKEQDVDATPAMRRNMKIYAQYNRLRMDNYFTEKVKSALKEGLCEYKLVKKRRNWGFNEVVYVRSKLRNITSDKLSGNNPYKKQSPFVRLENMYSSNCSSSVHLMNASELVNLCTSKCEKEFPDLLNLSNHLGLRISLEGNGAKSEDALCIRLRSSETGGYADYIIFLNFEGRRDVILTNLDNAEYRTLNFIGAENGLYNMHRDEVNFKRVKYIQVFRSQGCKDVRAYSIDAVPVVPNALTNPTIMLNKAMVTFEGTLQSGEYLEYNAGENNAIIYDSIGNARIVNAYRKGKFMVPEGAFNATVSGISEHDNMPAEVSLTFGLYGAFIHN